MNPDYKYLDSWVKLKNTLKIPEPTKNPRKQQFTPQIDTPFAM